MSSLFVQETAPAQSSSGHYHNCRPHIFLRQLSISFPALILLLGLFCSDRSLPNLMAVPSGFRRLSVPSLSTAPAVSIGLCRGISCGYLTGSVNLLNFFGVSSHAAQADARPDLSPTHYVSRTELLLSPAKTLRAACLVGMLRVRGLGPVDPVERDLRANRKQQHAPRLWLTPLQRVFLSYFDGLTHRHSSSEIGKCRPCQR